MKIDFLDFHVIKQQVKIKYSKNYKKIKKNHKNSHLSIVNHNHHQNKNQNL